MYNKVYKLNCLKTVKLQSETYNKLENQKTKI